MSAALPRRGADIPGPLAQSVRIGFLALYLAVGLGAAAWGLSNVRQVPPDSRAVVLRFGRVNRVQESGLLLAWPSPVETVRLLPARDRQVALKVAAEPSGIVSEETDVHFEPNDDIIHIRPDKDADNAAYLLTGDGNVVQLDGTLYYEIVDPAAYYLAESHVEPALHRLYLASAVASAATRPLDDFLVATPDQDAVAGAQDAADLNQRRAALRGQLADAINRRIAELRTRGVDLGVTVSRIDLVAVLPPVAKTAFDAVLTASQVADQTAAAARTDAARISQQAQRDRDRVLAEASAAADERIRGATADTAGVAALEARITPQTRDGLLAEEYRQRIAGIMRQAGQVTAIDMRSGQRLLLPGPGQ